MGEGGGRADKYTSGTLIKSRNVCRSLVSLILSAARTQTLSARKDVLVQFLLEVCWSLTPQRLIPGRSSRARVQERIYFCDVANPKVAVTLLVLMDESQAFRISFSGLRECQIRIKLCGCTYVCGRITYNATHLAFYWPTFGKLFMSSWALKKFGDISFKILKAKNRKYMRGFTKQTFFNLSTL